MYKMKVCIAQENNDQDFFQIWCDHVHISETNDPAVMAVCIYDENCRTMAIFQVDITKATIKREKIAGIKEIMIKYF